MRAFATLDDADIKNKRVLVRVDLNVPVVGGKVTDRTRIERIAPTIIELVDKGGKVILLSHFGRPSGHDPKQSLKLLAPAIADVLKRPVAFAEDCIGKEATAAVAAMNPGDIVCLENTRFHVGEEENDPDFVAKLAALGDIFVNDAFSVAHRAHASVEGLGHKLPTYAGRTMQAELEALTKALETPSRKKPPSGIILSQTSAGNTPCDARCFSEDDGRDMRGPRRRAGLRQSGPLLRNRGWGSERARAGAFQDLLILGAVVELLRNFDRRKFRDY